MYMYTLYAEITVKLNVEYVFQFVFLLKTKDDFENAYNETLENFTSSDLYRGNNEIHHYASFAYDAVWTMALALDRADAKLKSVLILSI